MSDHQHIARLLPAAKVLLDANPEERVRYINEDRWLPYGQADRLLDRLESLLEMPSKIRQPSLLICGDSHCGKSSLVRHFCDRHPATDGVYECACPVFYLPSCPPEPDEGRLYDEILTDLGIPFRYRDKPEQKLSEVKYQFEKIGVRMMILDEFANALSGSGPKQRVFMNAIKNLHNDLKIPMVLVGTMEAQYVTSSDTQFASRFKTEILPRWDYGAEFQRFLARLELTLPLQEGSFLAAPDLSGLIFDRAESGCIGDIVDLVALAAIMAIEKGTKKITKKEIKECDFTPSSKRQPSVGRA